MKHLFILLFFSVSVLLSGQIAVTPDDTVPNDSVVFSEIFLRSHRLASNRKSLLERWTYIEITNRSKRKINLGNYFMQTNFNNIAYIHENKYNPVGELNPGESYLLVVPYNSENVYKDGNGDPLFPDGIMANKILMDKADSVRAVIQLQNWFVWTMGTRYYNKTKGKIDSVFFDSFGTGPGGKNSRVVAGIPGNSSWDYVWVRKSSIKKGSINWDAVRGNDLADCEYIPIPFEAMYKYWDEPFTTAGIAGETDTINFISSKNPNITIEFNNFVINLPYGIRRDSVFRQFNLAENLGWYFRVGPDTSQYFVQTGDTLNFYLMGENLKVKRFHAQVAPVPVNYAGARPFIYKTGVTEWDKKWVVSVDKNAEMDSIGPIPFACHIDTFKKYTVFDGTPEIIFADGENSELKEGDLVKVTAADGTTTKTFKIVFEPYYGSYDPFVEKVIFPGLLIWENPITFEYSDTFFNFSGQSRYCVVDLPEDVKTSPDIVAVPRDKNTTIKVIGAKNLFGTTEERIVKLIAVAENRVDSIVYQIELRVNRPQPELDYTPFFTDIWCSTGMLGYWAMQLFNPSPVGVDMSDYLIVYIPGNIPINDFVAGNLKVEPAKYILRPGFKPVVNISDAEAYFQPDYDQKVSYLTSREVFSISCNRSFPMYDQSPDPFHDGTPDEKARLDFQANITSVGQFQIYSAYRPFGNNEATSTTALLKITNDSVKEGSKKINDLFNDYEVIDIINGFSLHGSAWSIADIFEGKDTIYSGPMTGTLYRKPNTYRGNPIDGGSFGLTLGDSIVYKPGEWHVGGSANPPMEVFRIYKVKTRYENFGMIYNDHLPYLTSNLYTISLGISTNEEIGGVPTGTTMGQMLSNLNPANPGMKIEVTTSTGIAKTPSEVMNEGDVVKSFSIRGIDSVVYKVKLGVSDGNVKLVSNEYSINVAADSKTGVISNVPFGVTVKNLEAKISTESPNARFEIVYVNNPERIFPRTELSNDTNLLGFEARMDVLASDGLNVKVTAQNGNVCFYSLSFAEVAMPYVLSQVYSVDQENKIINYVSSVSVDAFLAGLSPSPGATIRVVNDYGKVREVGQVAYRDRLLVTKGAVSVSYLIHFMSDENFNAIKGIKATNEMSAFPNPASSFVTIDGLLKGSTVSVYSISGVKVKSFKAADTFTRMDISKFTSGVYYVKSINKFEQRNIKLIVR